MKKIFVKTTNVKNFIGLVENLINKASGSEAYTIMDLGCHIGDDVVRNISQDKNVIRIRKL